MHHQLLAATSALGKPGLLGPTVTTLRGWLDDHFPCPAGWPVISEQERRLLLIEALLKHPGLYNHSPWGLANALLQLIDELNLARTPPAADADAFIKTLCAAYQLPAGKAPALEQEAMLVHTVWHAWQEQQQQEKRQDLTTAYCRQLVQAGNAISDGYPDFWFLATSPYSGSEQHFIDLLRQQQKAYQWVHGPGSASIASPAPPYSLWLDQVFPLTARKTQLPADLSNRASTFSRQYPTSPAADRLTLFTPDSAEVEAQAIAWQIDSWLNAGATDIAIVSDDRRLARRLRALCERRQIQFNDRLGWALSTTRAAAIIERLLQIVESDFEHQPLLDLLKSGALLRNWPEELREQTLRYLQRDIIERENTARNLSQYRQAHRSRHQRLLQAGLVNSGDDVPLYQLFEQLETAFSPLIKLYSSDKTQPGWQYLAALSVTMKQLDLYSSLAEDNAGEQLLGELENLDKAMTGRDIRLTWKDFRSWLGQSLEAASFREEITTEEHKKKVRLLTLEQTALQRFSHLIIASASKAHLNSHHSGSPFFNDAVRQQLGLTTTETFTQRRMKLFRACLESAAHILITAQGITQLSPWVELLNTFHSLAWQKDLSSDILRTWQDSYQQTTATVTKTIRPRPLLPQALLKKGFSASSLQRLIDCPYRYFAADGLGLTARDEVREALEKSDYGERIHRILQRFHEENGPIRDQSVAENTLRQLTRSEFSRDLRNDIRHHGWLARFCAIIPAYIAWQREREQHWQVERTEIHSQQEQDIGLEIHGRIDRIDKSPSSGNFAIIDYKTGACAKREQTLAGEAVQLPFYCLLLDEPVAEAIYLNLAKDSVKVPYVLDSDELKALTKANHQRLRELQQQLADGQAMPAWGDESSCRYCTMSGLCRKQTWEGLPE